MSSSLDVIAEMIFLSQFVLSVIHGETRKCVYFEETDFGNYFSEVGSEIGAYVEKLKYTM